MMPVAVMSQEHYTHQLSWLRLNLSDTINNKLEWEVSIQRRSQNNHAADDNIFHSFQFEGYSLAFEYGVSDKFSVSVMPLGFYRSHSLNVVPTDWERPSTKEWRSNIQLSYEISGRILTVTNRLSIDYRRRDFADREHYITNWRLRYMLRLEKEVLGIFSDVKPVTFTIFDEVFFQFGEAVKNNKYLFDQNRLFGGASYEIFKNTTLTLGYAYGFQIRGSGEQYDNINNYYAALAFENIFSQFARPKSKVKRNT